ncbi:HAD family hydrolase [Longispora albida]|uniref:HAD family hydrolase n=1 Tax=Longispora albida TaxID=203523 RepID=UPI000477C48C|nr:HAD-IA family hydrolase [Longispora albida]
MPLAVVFDFFGTLTRPVSRGTEHARVAAILGVTPQALDTVLGETFYSRATGSIGELPDVIRFLAGLLGVTASPAQVEAACAARLEVLRHDAQLRDDTLPTLAALRERGLRLALVSDCTNELPQLWPELEVSRYFDATVFSYAMGLCKPDQLMYKTACEALDVAPEDCLYVGDGGSNELTGALAAGMRAVRLLVPGHLSYNAETGWQGPVVTGLAEVLAHCDA